MKMLYIVSGIVLASSFSLFPMRAIVNSAVAGTSQPADFKRSLEATEKPFDRQSINDFVAIMAAFKGKQVAMQGDKKKSIHPGDGFADGQAVVYGYLDTLATEAIPFSTWQPKRLRGPIEMITHLSPFSIGQNGQIVAPYYLLNYEKEYFANVVQRYDLNTKKWETMYVDTSWWGTVPSIEKLHVLRDGKYIAVDRKLVGYWWSGRIKVIDPNAWIKKKRSLYVGVYSQVYDVLEFSPNKLAIGGNGYGELEFLDLTQKNDAAARIEVRFTQANLSRIHEAKYNHVHLLPMLNGFVSCNYRTLTQWQYTPQNKMKKLREFEFAYNTPGRIVSCACNENSIVCLFKTVYRDKEASENARITYTAIFFDDALTVQRQEPVQIIKNIFKKIIRFKDGSIGIFAGKYLRYSKEQLQGMDLTLLLPPYGQNDDQRILRSNRGPSAFIVNSDSDQYDFAIAYKSSMQGVAAYLFYNVGKRIQKLCDAYIASYGVRVEDAAMSGKK